jgi:hypothetical protein
MCKCSIDLQLQLVHTKGMNKNSIERVGTTVKADFVTKASVVEVKRHLSAIRALRDGMVQLAMRLADEPNKSGYLVAVDPRIRVDALKHEMDDFKLLMRDKIANRLKLVIFQNGQLLGPTSELDLAELGPKLSHWINAETSEKNLKLPNADKREEVFLTILHRWFTGQGPMTARSLEEAVGCAYRTVSAAVEQLGAAVERSSDRSIALKYFPEREWKRFLAVAQKVRSTLYYADASDQPRSPESLMRRLGTLCRKDIAIGGVLGAKHYFKDLDIIGMPRLDLCIHAPGGTADLDFVSRLDPALEQTRDPERPVRLALHFVRRKESLFDTSSDEMQWADPMECLSELYLAHLDQQAVGFQEYLIHRGEDLNGKWK